MDDSAYKKKSASEQMMPGDEQYGGGYETAMEMAKRASNGQYKRSSARPAPGGSAVAQQDARVKVKLGSAPAAKKTSKPGKTSSGADGGKPHAHGKSAPPAPAADDKETPVVITEVDLPAMWVFDAKNQKLEPHNLAPYLKQHGIEGDISIVSVAGRQSDSSVHAPMAITLEGLEEKDKPHVKGRDKDGNGYTTLVPRGSKFYEGGGDKLYERKNGDFDPADFADHMDVDVNKLRTEFVKYNGKGGSLSKSHIEVHEGGNPHLYQLITDSTNVESAFAGDSVDNPSIIVSRADHKRVVDKYLTDGGYKRANRVQPKDVKIYLHHVGTAHDSHSNEDSWTPATQLSGMTSAEKKELAQPTAQHRVTYEMRFQVAHKPKAKVDDDDDLSE